LSGPPRHFGNCKRWIPLNLKRLLLLGEIQRWSGWSSLFQYAIYSNKPMNEWMNEWNFYFLIILF
jgi:hypothetical protein